MFFRKINEMISCLFVGMAQLDSIGSSRISRLDNKWIGFLLQKVINLRQFAATGLAAGSNSCLMDNLLLDLLVTSVCNLGSIRQETHFFRQLVGQIHTSFSSTDNRNNGQTIGGLMKGLNGFLDGIRFSHYSVVGQSLTGFWNMLFHVVTKVPVPQTNNFVMSLLGNFTGNTTASGISKGIIILCEMMVLCLAQNKLGSEALTVLPKPQQLLLDHSIHGWK
mmetsp:Transcript_21058/g.51813  ORF Transcript_21058/g.51813 Transcript_21058/m.51813 type:complete len:221 (-) Transcript_21058:60-722(-)